MTKQVDEIIYKTIKNFLDDKFSGGLKTLGLKDKGVDYVYDKNNKELITKEVKDKVEDIRTKIISKEIIIKGKKQGLFK
jgi:basic membrane protein A